jgi:predicted phosphodiesterase
MRRALGRLLGAGASSPRRVRRSRSRLAFPGVLLALAACGGGGAHLGSPQPDFPAGIASGPMLAGAAPTSMEIAWTTDGAVIGSVDFGLTTSYGSRVVDASLVTNHLILLPGLRPQTTYHYRVLLGGVPAGGDHVFTTPPSDPAQPVRFVVVGDTGTGTQTALDVIARLEAQGPDFVVHGGDLAYANGSTQDVLERFTIPFAHTMDHLPLYAVLGNHDVNTGNGRPFLDAVVLPTNPVNHTERFYSFDWGPCHFAGLGSNADLSANSEQVNWLAGDLAASAAPWKFVFFHHPVWSSSRHGSRSDLQAPLSPVLEANHVDVVFNGHDHDYERTFPMVGAAPTDVSSDSDYVRPQGPIYVVTGGGGNGLYASGTSAFTAYSESSFHVSVVDVEGSTLTLTVVRLDGTVMDRASVSK